MQLEITKKCADSLRSFSQNNYGIQLKSSHAHELVAAYFGYSSRAALLADTKCPIKNLRQAEIIVLTPSAQIEERRKKLNGLPENLPHDLAEGVYLPLYDEKWITTKVWPNLDYVARFLVDEGLKPTPYFFSHQKIQREGIRVEYYGDGIHLKVSREYVSPNKLLSGLKGKRGIVYTFDLKRMAGCIGYGNVTVSSIEAETLEFAIEQMEVTRQHIAKVDPIEQSDLSFTS